VESLYLLIPLSVALVLGIGGLLAWSVMSGQFDEMEHEGERILDEKDAASRQKGERPDSVASTTPSSTERLDKQGRQGIPD
jgi:cbb3-type cytochrome oxidase maturation protein